MNILCVDLGGSKLMTSYAEVTQSGQSCSLNWPMEPVLQTISSNTTGDELIQQIESAIDALPPWDFQRVGITIPGLADPKKGIWVFAPFSGIRNLPIVEIFSRRLGGKPVYIENDVNACALAERYFGACKDCTHFLWTTVSNGIGGGLVLDGKIYSGAMGNAGEIGHVNVVENSDYVCGCGNRGCLEIEAAGPAIARKYHRRKLLQAAEGDKTVAPTPMLSAKEIASLARKGDPDAIEVYNEAGHLIGRAASWTVNLMNLQRVVIGGGVAGAFDLLKPEMERTFSKMVFQAANPNVCIVKTDLGYNAGLAGAAAIALE